MMQIYTVYVYELMIPSTCNPSPSASVALLLLGGVTTKMHNVVVPLIDNPAAFRDSPRDLLTQHGGKSESTCLCTTRSKATPEQKF